MPAKQKKTAPKIEPEIAHLGSGVLTWERSERVSDRYGAVYLMADGNNSLTGKPVRSLVSVPASILGETGELYAVVTQTRESTHIGDFFRGVAPRTPKVGQRIAFGRGELFEGNVPDGGKTVGLKPSDGRDSDWLDIRALYDAHEQTVDLFFAKGTAN